MHDVGLNLLDQGSSDRKGRQSHSSVNPPDNIQLLLRLCSDKDRAHDQRSDRRAHDCGLQLKHHRIEALQLH